LLLKKQFSEEQALEALKTITLEDVKAYTQKLYEKVHITGVAHGNWTDQKVQESIRNLLAEIGSRPLPENERFEQQVEYLAPGERILFSKKIADNNNSMAYAMQLGKRSFDLQAQATLIASIIESDFYTQMRTNQQLGYIVWSFRPFER
jgi:secreted Zn-dependent insulinase-like peptidase